MNVYVRHLPTGSRRGHEGNEWLQDRESKQEDAGERPS